MGLLQNGQWVDQWYDTKDSGGEYRRQDSRFRNWLTADGAAGPAAAAHLDGDLQQGEPECFRANLPVLVGNVDFCLVEIPDLVGGDGR